MTPAVPDLPMPSELQLVAACCRWPDNEERRAAIRASATSTQSWERVLRLAERHRVVGLLQQGLTAAGIAAPDDASRTITRRAQDIAMGELRMARETLQLVRALEAQGIGVRVLKGSAVAMLAFRRLGLRFNHDIDLLVAPADIEAAALCLRAAGYRRTEPAEDISPDRLKRWLRDRKDMAYRHTQTGLLVELHWRLFDNPHLLPALAGTDSQPVELSPGQGFKTLASEPLPVYLAMHGALHAWARLKWLADLGALLAAMPAPAADALVSGLRDRSARRALIPALVLCHQFFGTYLPPAAAQEWSRSRRMRYLHNVAVRCLIGDGDGTELEAEKFGTTRKNISHYLLGAGLRYRMAEARFDFVDDRDKPIEGAWRVLGPLARPAIWIGRKVRGGHA